MILVGSLETITQSFAVINGSKYEYSDPVKAIQATYKCTIALRTFPYMSDYVWMFIRKLFFGISPSKGFSTVSKFIVDLKKV